jgi:hypothetical protein
MHFMRYQWTVARAENDPMSKKRCYSGQSVPKNVKSVLLAPYGRVASCQTPATSSPFSIWRHRRLGYTYKAVRLVNETS